jgi:hypothetical protein
MKHLKVFEEFANEAVWSGDVETKFHPKEGIFTKSASEIAKYLKDNSKDLKQAMSRLVYFINRGGKNIKKEDRDRLDLAKEKLRKLYEK